MADLKALLSICDRITLNSLRQLEYMSDAKEGSLQLGIRVNPETTFVTDARYDPCRRNLKLGVPAQKLRAWLAHSEASEPFQGFTFTATANLSDLGELTATLQRIETILGDHMRQFRWLNVGGGYTYEEESDVSGLCAELLRIRRDYNLEVVMEPGAAFVRRAGYFISSVVDISDGEEYPIAILDLTVNHWPEVFEYQFEPDVVGQVHHGNYTYMIAGCKLSGWGSIRNVFVRGASQDRVKSCLRERRRLFDRQGARVNGINLPNIYTLTEEGELVLKKSFTYEDFASRCGVEPRAVV